MASLVNALIGEYRVTEFLGAGGMGEVYKAEHTHLARVIAIKVLTAGTADTNALRRFYGEADIQASLRHPGVAEYFGFYEYQGHPCILMEYVDGETLSDMIEHRGALPVAEAYPIACALASVAAHFHAQGVVHRDIKTSNVKITSTGAVKVLDFGIALVRDSQRRTVQGVMVGTPSIVAPEQLQNGQLTPGTDVWQLGVLMYEMLTGQLPFQGSDADQLFHQILHAGYRPVSQIQPSVPRGLERVIDRCLQKSPLKRFASGSEVLAALQAANPAARTDLSAQAVSAPRSRTPLYAMVGGGAALLTVILIIVFSGSPTPNPTPTPTPPVPPVGSVVPANRNGSGAELRTVVVDTYEGTAQVIRDGKVVGKTPYQISTRTGDQVNVVLHRDGFKDLPVQFEVTERKMYTYPMDPLDAH